MDEKLPILLNDAIAEMADNRMAARKPSYPSHEKIRDPVRMAPRPWEGRLVTHRHIDIESIYANELTRCTVMNHGPNRFNQASVVGRAKARQ
jgi:hypothetical protein